MTLYSYNCKYGGKNPTMSINFLRDCHKKGTAFLLPCETRQLTPPRDLSEITAAHLDLVMSCGYEQVLKIISNDTNSQLP